MNLTRDRWWKPRLRMKRGVWECEGRGYIGYGATWRMAFNYWSQLVRGGEWRQTYPAPVPWWQQPPPPIWTDERTAPWLPLYTITCAAKGLQ